MRGLGSRTKKFWKDLFYTIALEERVPVHIFLIASLSCNCYSFLDKGHFILLLSVLCGKTFNTVNLTVLIHYIYHNLQKEYTFQSSTWGGSSIVCKSLTSGALPGRRWLRAAAVLAFLYVPGEANSHPVKWMLVSGWVCLFVCMRFTVLSTLHTI